MTDELSPEFLRFSELLDQEDNPPPIDPHGEGGLLMDLRSHLRENGALTLPENFARTTAQRVEQRFQAQSDLSRTLVTLEPVLAAKVLSARALPWVLLVALAGLISMFTSRLALSGFGVTLLLAALGWKALCRRYLADVPEPIQPPMPAALSRSLARIFYAVPVLATLATGLLCGRGVAALGRISLTFRDNQSSLGLLGLVAGGAVFVLLLSGLAPTWKALQARSSGRPGWLLAGQLTHALWLGLALQLLSSELSLQAVWGLTLGLTVVVVLLLSRMTPTVTAPGQLRAGLSQSLRSLLFGGVPIVGTLVGFYQLNLTRQIDQPLAYQNLVKEVQAWEKEQKATPPEQNGWIGLKPYFLKRDKPSADYLAVRDRLKAGQKVYDFWLDKNPYGTDKTKAEQAERDFLRELPRVEAALQKPTFRYHSTQNLRMQSLVPDFITCRAISQGLAGLAVEALKKGHPEESLHYDLLNLRWARCVREGTLINLMIGIAQMSIALEPVEGWLSKGTASTEQLQQILTGLKTANIPRSEFWEAMKRETYACDMGFQEILLASTTSGGHPGLALGDSGWDTMVRIAPKGYWESERKMYLNLQLSQASGWRELGRPSDINIEEMLPLSFATREFVPNSQRAQVQFMLTLSRLSALQTVTALELCRRERGAYPDHLQELVPTYLDKLPVDAIQPNPWSKKPGFDYHKTAQGYQLISDSPLYEKIRFQSRQVFQPGKIGLEKLPQP